jgi:hypothetical protein
VNALGHGVSIAQPHIGDESSCYEVYCWCRWCEIWDGLSCDLYQVLSLMHYQLLPAIHHFVTQAMPNIFRSLLCWRRSPSSQHRKDVHRFQPQTTNPLSALPDPFTPDNKLFIDVDNDNSSELRPPSAASRLCGVCRSLGQLPASTWTATPSIKFSLSQAISHHEPISALIRSASTGCRMCSLMLGVLETKYRLQLDEDGNWKVLNDSAQVVPNDRVSLEFTRSHLQEECETPMVLLIRLFETDEMSVAVLRTLLEECRPDVTDTSTGSVVAMCRVKAWLDVCASMHSACKRESDLMPVLPTRVLAVRGKGAIMSHLVRGEGRRGEYATLSHCWGGSDNQPLTTTDATLALREQGIGDEELPKTFREAVQVCRELGIGYLWIDSLCIIQGQASKEDWTKEAPKMGHIYGNSMLTIAASDAASSDQGCFRDRHGLRLWSFSMSLHDQRWSISHRLTKSAVWHSAGDLNGDDVWLPLNDRAWVVQEQILSPRLLSFTHDCIVWRCNTMSANERHPMGLSGPSPHRGDLFRAMHCILSGIEQSSTSMDPYSCWYHVVNAFTARNLTFQDDKLPALAGIAKRFAAITNDTYHAGLWRRDLLTGMLWYLARPSVTAKETRAPSWSWASVNCKTYNRSIRQISGFGDDHLHILSPPLLEILEVVDPPTCTEHPFGATSKAMLRLSGALLPVTMTMGEHRFPDLTFTQHDTGSGSSDDFPWVKLDELKLPPAEDAPWFCLPVCVDGDPYSSSISFEAGSYEASWKRSLESDVDGNQDFRGVSCLLLQTVCGRQDTYSRIGICEVDREINCKIGRIGLRQRQTLTII